MCCRALGRSTCSLSASTNTLSSRFPEIYHITTWSPAAIISPPNSTSRGCAPLVDHRSLIADYLRCGIPCQPWIGLQLPPLVGELAEAPCATGHRVACSVVSTDQEQPEQCAAFVERGRAHPLVMSEERDDIVALLFLLTPLPELHHGHIKILKA